MILLADFLHLCATFVNLSNFLCETSNHVRKFIFLFCCLLGCSLVLGLLSFTKLMLGSSFSCLLRELINHVFNQALDFVQRLHGSDRDEVEHRQATKFLSHGAEMVDEGLAKVLGLLRFGLREGWTRDPVGTSGNL